MRIIYRLFPLGLALCCLLILTASGAQTAALPPPHLGYGFNVATLDTRELQAMGFDWVKLFGAPGERHAFNVLLRVDATADHLSNPNSFAASMRDLASQHGEKIEAYEIGNEPNLDASYGWNAAPDAANYVQLLCAAYAEIHAADAQAVVVSAGLAPTGRVTGDWNGHAGHNGLFQDEREWFKEFLAAGGAECADAFGYHPYGYRADFDVPPDVTTNDPLTNCTNGFCFRGVEKLYEIMVAEGVDDKQVWATEYGWIVEPPDSCLNDATWQGRHWQIVSEQEQADNLAGSFAWADEHWPWMGPMIVFNYNFNSVPWYGQCDQLRYYAVADRAAQAALANLPKRYASEALPLELSVPSLTWFVERDAQPVVISEEMIIGNVGTFSAEFNLSINNAGGANPEVAPLNGTLDGNSTQAIQIELASINRPTDIYTATLSFRSDVNAETTFPIKLVVAEEITRVYLPIVSD